ncbi:MAG: hypothetical protein AAEJ04_10255 [Planctomycetota bacterium]
MTKTTDSTTPDPPRPLFKLGGCLLALFLAICLGALIAAWMVISGGLPSAPLRLPVLVEPNTLVNWDLDRQKLEQGEELELTPDHWNYFIAEIIDAQINAGSLLPGSGARLIPQPDGPLQLLLTLGFPSDRIDVPWLLRDRFINLEIIGDLQIASGTLTHAKLDLYQWGSIYWGKDMDEEASKKLVADLLEEIKLVIGPIRQLEYDGTSIKFSLDR